MPFDLENPESCDAYMRSERELETAWQSALLAFRCVECARLHLAQSLRGMAHEKSIEIMGGVDWINNENASVENAPVEKDGIRRLCKDCQQPLPPGTIQFFKHGADK